MHKQTPSVQEERQQKQAKAERDKRRPPIKTLEWLGLSLRVLNQVEGRKLLRKVRGPDDNVFYNDSFHLTPDAQREDEHAVFLLAEDPIDVDALVVTRRLENYPQLRIDGLICTAVVQARQIQVGDVTRPVGPYHDDPDGNITPVLAVFAPVRADLVVLANGCHAFNAGLDCNVLIATDLDFSYVLVRGPSRVDALIETSGNVFFPEQPPQINFHVSRGKGRVWFCRTNSDGTHTDWWFTQTHNTQDIIAPPFLGHDAYGYVDLAVASILTLPSAAQILRPADEIAQVYADFPAQLTQAMDDFAALLDAGASGLSKLYHGTAEFSLVVENLEGQKVRCRQLLATLKETDFVIARALQRLDDGRLLLHITHETSPKRNRHARWANLNDNDAEACTIKWALRNAIASLRHGYKGCEHLIAKA